MQSVLLRFRDRFTPAPLLPMLVPILLAIHAALVAWVAWRTSPTFDEIGHLPAGIYSWTTGRFDVYRVNPPLVRLVAALPVVLSDTRRDWSEYRYGPSERPEWSLGRRFIAANREDWRWHFARARWAVIPLSLLGGYVCYRWARELYGTTSGVAALTLWCFSPNLIAWGATITPDAAAAATGVSACYCFWRWLKSPSWTWTIAAGIALGIAELTKTTWIVLFVVWPAVWLASKWPHSTDGTSREAVRLAMALVIAVWAVNLGYGFEGSFKPLGDYTFVSRTLAGSDSPVGGDDDGGNRFRDSALARIPVPLPQNYVSGMDLQKADFESGKWSYLNGTWKFGGWWHYYAFALAYKVPLGTWALLALALAVSAARNRNDVADESRTGPMAAAAVNRAGSSAGSRGWRDELALLAPCAAVLVLVSSQTGFSRYFRYILPCLPFIFIWASKAVRSFMPHRRPLSTIALGAIAYSVWSSISVYPHSMSYFNELAGGPVGGHHHLIDANIDWGQDLFYLKEWYDRHPRAGPFYLSLYAPIDPRIVGIRSDRLMSANDGQLMKDVDAKPRPGWYAISVHRLHDRASKHQHFQHIAPIAMIGYSIYIYHVTDAE